MKNKIIRLLLLVRIRFQVLFHSPCRGSFRLSLTVLVHYRSVISIQPWRMVPPYSDKIKRVPSYSLSPQYLCFRIRGHHPLQQIFPNFFPNKNTDFNSGLFPVRSPLLRESHLISFPRGTKMFQFPRFALFNYEFIKQ